MSKRIKSPSILPLKTRAEAEQEAQKLAITQLRRQAIEAQRGEAVLRAAESFNLLLEPLEASVNLSARKLELWAEQNAAEFGELKSLKLAGHTIGWRLGKWATKTLPGVTWGAVLEQLKALKMALNLDFAARAEKYLRIVEEPNKVAMIEDREDEQAREFLTAVGVTFAQAEAFFFEPSGEPLTEGGITL